jgi:hypothetical protein
MIPEPLPSVHRSLGPAGRPDSVATSANGKDTNRG